MPRTRQGMTLVELMTALAILGILLGLAVTGYGALIRHQRASAAERAILLAAQEARQRARATRSPVRLARVTTHENGVPVPGLRWEKLDCADTDAWGSECPRSACLTAACGTGGCTCTEVGDAIALTAGLDVDGLHGLCWLGDSGRPVAPGASMCAPDGAAPEAGTLRVLRKRDGEERFLPSRVLSVDALTGTVSMTDCASHPEAGGCSP